MSILKYYFDLMSQPCRAVYIFLKINNIGFVPKQVALRKAEHLGGDYAKINPFKLVPFIDDNGFKLGESVAILRYLCDKYKVNDTWYPKDLQKRALVDRYLEWQHLGLRAFGSMVFREQVIIPMMTQKPINTERLKHWEEGLERTLDLMENVFLNEHNYLGADHITIADVLGICELMQTDVVHYPFTKNRPKLAAWTQKVKQELQPHFDESHKFVFKLRDKFDSKL